jgi:hypothetical protein
VKLNSLDDLSLVNVLHTKDIAFLRCPRHQLIRTYFTSCFAK